MASETFFDSSVVPSLLGERTGQLWRDKSRRVRTHEKNSGDAVRQLVTIIQSIFCARSGTSILLTVWKWSGKSRYPGAFPPVLENFCRAFSPCPTDRPWVSEGGSRKTCLVLNWASASCSFFFATAKETELEREDRLKRLLHDFWEHALVAGSLLIAADFHDSISVSKADLFFSCSWLLKLAFSKPPVSLSTSRHSTYSSCVFTKRRQNIIVWFPVCF